MRCTWLFALAACGGSGKQDAGGRHDAAHCVSQPAPGPSCYSSCGNGVAETCYVDDRMDSPCAVWVSHIEACDGSDVPSCASLGYGGGSATCNSDCTVSASTCDACGSDARVVECAPLMMPVPQLLVASAPGAAGGPYLALGGGNTVTVLHHDTQGFSVVGSESVVSATQIMGTSIAPLVDGWLVATITGPGTAVVVTRTDLLATTATQHTLATGTSISEVSIAYGPGGHALVAWTDNVPDANQVFHPETWTAVVDAAGATVVAPSILVPSTSNLPGSSVTTDGTSFFVAVSGQIDRIASDGSVAAVMTGYQPVPYPPPLQAPVVVRWGTSNGWYAVQGSYGAWAAQAFDATGAASGPQLSTGPGPYGEPVAESTDLVAPGDGGAGTTTSVPFMVTRTPPSGTPVTSVNVGVIATGPDHRAIIAPFAGDIAVAWLGAGKYYVALVAL